MAQVAERKPTRAERVAQLQALLDEGLTNQQAAERMGLSPGHVRDLRHDPDGSKHRARLASYGRLCAGGCGRRTSGSNGRTGAPEYCASCSAKNRRYWTPERVIDAIQRWAAAHNGKPPSATAWMNADPENGYPSSSAVYSPPSAPFDSWADAIEAAGFPRPRPGYYERTPEHIAYLAAIHLRYSEQQLLDHFARLAEQLGRTPTRADIDRAAPPNSKVYYTRLGGLQATARRLGLPPRAIRERVR